MTGATLDYQILFNGAVTFATFMGGWVLNNITSTLNLLNSDIRQLPTNYVSKVDYRADMHDIKELLTRIDGKLDGKADKNGR